ncbi:MAG: M48 family metalloprotease [Gemmataceae bacterium]
MRFLLPALCLIAVTPSIRAGEDDEKLFNKVMARLLSADLVRKEYPDKYLWPPKYFVKPDSAKELNAYATAHVKLGAIIEDGKTRPVVMMTEGYLTKLVKGNENICAAVMGHELAHLTKDHVGGSRAETGLLFLAFSRDHEIEADLSGMRYALAAGYPCKESITGAFREMKKNTSYTSFEGLHTTHPSWDERLMFLDREQAKLWSAMSAFNNGALFLQLEQYPAAEQCFRAVVKEFPECHEGWANLGYTLLMRYCDALDADDLRHFRIGHIVAGCFYNRPDSLESKVRGIDEKTWHKAVEALKTALALKEDMVLPRACLGIAYLVHPEGKDVKQARLAFEQALASTRKDKGVRGNLSSLMSLLINAGVTELADGNVAAAEEKFGMAERVGAKLDDVPLIRTLDVALLFNQALVASEAKDADAKRAALKKWQRYLALAGQDSAWWPLAYDRYAKLARELGDKVTPAEEIVKLLGPAPTRLTTSVTSGANTVFLSEPIEQAVADLGKGEGVPQPLFPKSKFIRWRFASKGIDVLGKDKVLAIYLTSAKGPPIIVQAAGSSTKGRELRVGMKTKEVTDVLGDQPVTHGYLTDPDRRYRLYPLLGLALRFNDEDRIEEMALARVPRMEMRK